MADTNHLIRLSELLDIVPFSRSHLYRLEKTGSFPRRLKLGVRRIGWRSTDISKWISDRANEADAESVRHDDLFKAYTDFRT